METPCFLRSGSAGDMTLTTLGPRIGFQIPKNMAVLPPSSPEVSRNGEQAAATLVMRTTSSSSDAAIHAGPVCPSVRLQLFGVDKEQRTRGAWGRDSVLLLVLPPCPSLLLPPVGFTLGLF